MAMLTFLLVQRLAARNSSASGWKPCSVRTNVTIPSSKLRSSRRSPEPIVMHWRLGRSGGGCFSGGVSIEGGAAYEVRHQQLNHQRNRCRNPPRSHGGSEFQGARRFNDSPRLGDRSIHHALHDRKSTPSPAALFRTDLYPGSGVGTVTANRNSGARRPFQKPKTAEPTDY